jgi:hypothetical protein
MRARVEKRAALIGTDGPLSPTFTACFTVAARLSPLPGLRLASIIPELSRVANSCFCALNNGTMEHIGVHPQGETLPRMPHAYRSRARMTAFREGVFVWKKNGNICTAAEIRVSRHSTKVEVKRS